MKFNPRDFKEVIPNESHKAEKGVLRVRLSASCPLFVSAQGHEALAGVGTAFDLEISEAVTYRAEAPKGVRMFVTAPPSSARPFSGEVFTNIDRMADESGSVLEVTRALRQLELMRRSALNEIRMASRAAAVKADAVIEPALEPAPALVPEPDKDAKE